MVSSPQYAPRKSFPTMSTRPNYPIVSHLHESETEVAYEHYQGHNAQDVECQCVSEVLLGTMLVVGRELLTH